MTCTYTPPGTGAVTRDVGEKLSETLSAFDFIPTNLHAGIQARTDTTDLSSHLQDAITQINAMGGGELFLPAGKYTCGDSLTLCQGLKIRGAGRVASTISFTHAGTDVPSASGLKSLEAINSSTAVHITIESIGLTNTNSLNVGALIYDRGGTFLSIRDCVLFGGKYGIVFDQTELSDVDLCDFEGQTAAGLWLVNGASITVGASSLYTNRISVNRCQFNGGPAVYGIVDDGGNAHSFQDNNYNGCLSHIRAAGVQGLSILGGEFESAAGAPIHLDYTRLAGGGVGQCSPALVQGAEIVPSGANSAINIVSAGMVVVQSCLLGNTGSTARPAIDGAENVYSLSTRGNYLASVGPLVDALATVTMLDEARNDGAATYDPPSLAAGAKTSIQTMTVNGAAVGDFVEAVTFSSDLAGARIAAWVSATNTVSFYFVNENGGNPLDLASGTIRVKLRKLLI